MHDQTMAAMHQLRQDGIASGKRTIDAISQLRGANEAHPEFRQQLDDQGVLLRELLSKVTRLDNHNKGEVQARRVSTIRDTQHHRELMGHLARTPSCAQCGQIVTVLPGNIWRHECPR